MKTLLLGVTFLVASAFTTKTATNNELTSYYQVELISNMGSGTNYDWVWRVTNPDPGNGRDGTLQDLSHWSLVLPTCVTQADIVSAAYSTDGIVWNNLPATIEVDPSQGCYTLPVLKFNVGFPGTTAMYYKLTVNRFFTTGYINAVFKSGKWTGCFINPVEAMSCPIEDEGPRR